MKSHHENQMEAIRDGLPTMQWIKFSRYNLPPQGLKIVCFNAGDVWIARRLNREGKDYWVEIPYGGKHGSILTDPPKYWMPLDLPEGYKGIMQVAIEDSELMILDVLEKLYPEVHSEFVKLIIESSDDEA
jgi:hypothetical protein